MSIFKKFSDYIHYLLDLLKEDDIHIKIDSIKFMKESFIVSYHANKHDINSVMELDTFNIQYFRKVSNNDKNLITKYLVYQDILLKLFFNQTCNKEDFLKYIQMELEKNE